MSHLIKLNKFKLKFQYLTLESFRFDVVNQTCEKQRHNNFMPFDEGNPCFLLNLPPLVFITSEGGKKQERKRKETGRERGEIDCFFALNGRCFKIPYSEIAL